MFSKVCGSEKMSFSDEKVQQVWEKATIIANNNPNVWRQDKCGSWINRTTYGENARNSQYGWEVHHIDPKGGDDLSNLMPLQWENNMATADSGDLVCVVTASGVNNTKK